MTSRKSSGFWSTILETLFCPAATTRISTGPNFFTAASTIASQFASELGRLTTASTLPPSCSHSAATFFSSAALLAQSTTLAPAAASTLAASAPKAPVAPVTIALLPRMSNKESGFLRNSSAMTITRIATFVRPDEAAVIRLEHGLLAAGDESELALEHVIDLLHRRGIWTSAAARQKVRKPNRELLRPPDIESEEPQRAIGAMVRRFIRLGLAQMLHLHQNFSPFSIR